MKPVFNRYVKSTWCFSVVMLIELKTLAYLKSAFFVLLAYLKTI